MNNFIKQRFLGLSVASLVLFLDILTKELALKYITGIHEIIDGLFNLRLVFNFGVSFSLFGSEPVNNQHIFLGGFAFLAAIWFVYLMGNKRGTSKFFVPGLAFIVGGAVGNGLDRFRHGAVVDFLDFYYGSYHWPTFNVADIFISLGVFMLLIDAWKTRNFDNKINKG